MLRLSIAVVVLLTAPALAMFMLPPDVPVDRLIRNVTAYIKANPADPEGYYTLGRINSLAFHINSTTIGMLEDPENPEGRLPTFPVVAGMPKKTPPTEAQRKQYLADALANLRKAVEMKPAKALYRLTLAFTLEQGAPMAIQAATQPATRPASEAWLDEAMEQYWQAHELAANDDLKIEHRPVEGLESLVSFEAGNAYKRLAEQRGVTDKDKPRLAKIEGTLAALKAKPMGAVTPIVFALDRQRPLADLLAPQLEVAFDLDGTGRGFRWPWVRPETAILAWDPRGTGQITSGMQLFGSVTWHIYWPDGYRAMDALDDDRDGYLTGDELRGLAIWQDRNANGQSDPGEVMPVESAGISALATQSTGRESGCPAASHGVHLRDGRQLRSYDWIARPRTSPLRWSAPR